MSWARIHRWLAILLVVLLVVWSVTGLLFHLKPGWDRAYDSLSAERRGAPIPAAASVPLESIRAHLGAAALTRVELFDTALGPLVRATTSDATALFDATTGKPRSPLTSDEARTLADDAIARSPHRAAYGRLATTAVRDDAVDIRYTGATVTVGRRDARISQRGPDTNRIDWLYRIHYLQWTGHRTIDQGFAIFGLALIWAVMLPGLVLFARRLTGG